MLLLFVVVHAVRRRFTTSVEDVGALIIFDIATRTPDLKVDLIQWDFAFCFHLVLYYNNEYIELIIIV